MGLSITGYVLEPTRVGQANSPFTWTPNIYVSNQAAFDAAYPTSEANPRTDYHVVVLADGDLPDAILGWTKNEVIQRFDYEGREQRFKTLPGSALEVVGTLAADSNTNRIQVAKPISTDLVTFPIRVSVGTGSGTTFTVALVLNDGSFGSPAPGTVELSRSTGNLNWNTSDLTTFGGQPVRFQRQTFFTFQESNGKIGLIEEVLLLNPLPATGQYPLIRIGFGDYLLPVEVANDAALAPAPPSGSVKWSRTTGRLAFNAAQATANAQRPIYYDGVLISGTLTVTPIVVGTVNTPGTIFPVPPEDSDTFFRVPGVVQFPQTRFVNTLSTNGKKGRVEIRRSDGQIRFSKADRNVYGSLTAEVIVPDILIERGMSLQLFRTPVDPAATDPDLKDVSAFYTTENATLADPIVASPQVFLPAVPVDTLPFSVNVANQSGALVPLPRLDVPSPPVGVGYFLNFDDRTLIYAQRKVNQVIPAPLPYGAVSLPDPLVSLTNLTLELETPPNSTVYIPLTLNEDALFDPGSGTVTLVETDGELITSGSGGSFSGTNFTDSGQNFTLVGVNPGDLLIVQNGLSKGVYTVSGVTSPTLLTTDLPGTTESNLIYEIRRGQEILADRFFQEVPPLDPNTKVERVTILGLTTNAPRLSILVVFATKSRFRFGSGTFSTSVVTVANDGAFTAPASLPQGTVEVSLSTGNLNFSQADVTAGLDVYWVKTLTLSTDYRVQPVLGFIEFADRFLQEEEAIVTYKNADGDIVVEPATFLVRKELTAPHPTPTNTLTFNPLGRPVASVPAPRVFRGGRPQVNGEQVNVNTTASTITFLPDNQITEALPHGALVKPTERVYIDYYVTKAVGGESSITVLQPPMAFSTVLISAGTSSFTLLGDRTALFGANRLLRVNGDRQETYLLGSPSYDGGTDTTTVNLASPQTFRSDVRNPGLFVTSGQTRTTAFLFFPSYFVTEVATFQSVPRGSNKVRLNGDLATTYGPGRVLHFTDGTTSFLDFYLSNGAVFKSEEGFTEVTLTSNTARQYGSSTILKRSVRPILEASATTAQTSRGPILSLPFTVFRRVEGEVGVLLSQPTGYEIDDSGRVTFSEPLEPNEAWSVLYTGATFAQAGQSLRASYTFQIVPGVSNGLLNQTLFIDYTTYAPDTVFWRVETFTNFRAELAAQYTQDAQASIPSGGPTLENSSAPRLYEQGRESVFFQERHLSNEDIVARATLKFYNDSINFLEDVLQEMDGRIVGDRDGRFVFDGLINNPDRTTFSSVTNQIDDRFKISAAPYSVTFPPFAVNSIGTFRAVYLPAKTSRFYPSRRKRYGVTVSPSGLSNGDSILDTGSKNLTGATSVQRRFPWAVVVKAALAGSTTISVDNVNGAEELLRPAFAATQKVRIADTTTTYADPLTILSVASGPTPNTITFTTPLLATVPAGATVFLSTSDTVYRKFYRVGTDVGVDLEEGQLTHIEPFPPLDGSVPAIPSELLVQNPAGGEVLDMFVTLNPLETSPDRFPALDGLTTDDDGDRQLPVIGPTFNCESVKLNSNNVGHLATEKEIIQTTPAGTLRAATTPSFVDVGSLNGAGTIITGSGPFPATVKVFDLVRILTGVNALSSYHQITTVLGSTITVTPPFTTDAGFTYTVTASTSLATSATGTISPTTTLTDPLASFVAAGVLPGHTVVITVGATAGQRRQVVTVAPTVLTVSPAFTATGAVTYRVDNALGTFGGAGSIIAAQLVPTLSAELAILDSDTPPGPWSERQGIEQFYDSVFTNLVTSSTGQTTIASPTLTDTLDFDAAGVNATHFVFIRSGTVAGVYRVQSVTSPTTLDIDSTFPATASGITYRVVSSLATRESLEDLFTVLQGIDTLIGTTTAFSSLLTTPVGVLPDASSFATGLLTSNLNTRETEITTRISDLDFGINPNGPVGTISGVLADGDRFYDKRFVWIDSRINRETGILEKRSRAVSDRIKAQADILKQLTKLLTA